MSPTNLVDKLRGYTYKLAREAKEYICSTGAVTTTMASPQFGAILYHFARNFNIIVDHWAGDHSKCHECLQANMPCQQQNGAAEENIVYYEKGGETHKALAAFVQKHYTPKALQHIIMARENYHVETFNSVIGKYATKRTHYHATHWARLCMTQLDWNENIGNKVLKTYERKTDVSTNVRKRPGHIPVKEKRTWQWKLRVEKVWKSMYDE